MQNFIEVTHVEGQKHCVNVRYIIRFNERLDGAVLYIRNNGSFRVMYVQESYEEIKKLINKASEAN